MTQLTLSDLWAPEQVAAQDKPNTPSNQVPETHNKMSGTTGTSGVPNIRACTAIIRDSGKRDPIGAIKELSKLLYIHHRMGHQPFLKRPNETTADLAERLRKTFREEQKAKPAPFEEGMNALDATTIEGCAAILAHPIQWTAEDRSNREFRHVLEDLFRGDYGQYLTPRTLMEFAVACMDPQQGERVLDPACGSGGFLATALAHMSRRGGSPRKDLYGMELNEGLSGIARTTMMLHDTGPDAAMPTIINNDALRLMADIRDHDARFRNDSFDVVITNPPFGNPITRETHGDAYVDQYSIARQGTKRAPASIRTEVAFLERVHDFLKAGTGRAAILVPDGLLSNKSTQPARDWLLNHFQLQAVISLPAHALNHQRSGAKTSFLFLRKLHEGETVPDESPILMAMVETVGYAAAGRPAWDNVHVETETPGYERRERQACDLFEQRTRYHWKNQKGWTPTDTRLIPGTGLVGQWETFQTDPRKFRA